MRRHSPYLIPYNYVAKIADEATNNTQKEAAGRRWASRHGPSNVL